MTIFEKVREIIADDSATDPSIITPDAILEGGDIYVSLDIVEGIMACEEYFEIKFDDEDIAATENTVGGLVVIITRKLREKPMLSGHIQDLTF